MKRLSFLSLALLLALVACKKESSYSLQLDFASDVAREHARYSALPLLATPEAVQAARMAEQAALLAAFDKDPEAFLKKYTGGQRTFLFDAVVDAKNQLRVGRIGDGGKWLADPQSLPAKPVVYSFGVGDDISFDTAMAGLFGCDVHLFDPNPAVTAGFKTFKQGSACGKGSVSYHDVGLGPCSDDPKTRWELDIDGKKCAVKDLAALAKQLGHPRVDVLKVDIEGGELTALPASLAAGTFEALAVKQLLVEIHIWDDGQFRRFVKFIGELKKHGYELFRKEFNPYDGARCAEFAFVRVR